MSNFLLWELAYSELVFTDVLWPDFRKQHLFAAIAEYQARERRYGGLAGPDIDGVDGADAGAVGAGEAHDTDEAGGRA